MVALKILEIKKAGVLVLQEKESEKIFELMFQFFGVNANVSDTIILNEKLLNPNFEGFIQPYAFEKCDKKVEEIDAGTEFSVLHKMSGENLVIQRVYG